MTSPALPRLALLAAVSLACAAPAAEPAPAPVPAPSAAEEGTSDPHLALALHVLRTTPLVDGHNDLPWAIRESESRPRDVEAYDLRRRTPGHTDIERLRRGHVGGQFWSVYIPGDIRDSGFARVQLEQIDIARRIVARYPELRWATTADSMRRAFHDGAIGAVLGVEGGHAIENSLGALRAYYDLGARYMTLTHSVTTDWADAAGDEARHGGLTRFGEEVVREMNRLGMLVDLSHVTPATMSDALNVSRAPVVFSHSSARAVTDVPRNVPDSILRRLPANGGVVMVTFVPGFVSQAVADHAARAQEAFAGIRARAGGDVERMRRERDAWRRANPAPRATIADVADHLDHIRRVAGAAHVGIGGDFDGITETVVGLEDVSTYPALFAELARRGWSEGDLRRLAGENILRVMARAEGVGQELRRTTPPSTRTIEELDGRR
ncbi:MAG TPA: dipeptidase [Gemmatimonadaceae bacterium]